MADDAGAADAEQGAAAELLVLEPRLEVLQAARDRRPSLGRQGGQEAGQFLLEGREEELDGPLARLEQHVADEPLADDDPGVPLVDVAPLDVADEPLGQRAVLEERARGLGQVVPLVLLGADVQQADRGCGDAEDRLGVDRPHDAVLVQVLGLGDSCWRRRR